MTQAFKSHLNHQESIFKNVSSSSTSGSIIIIENYVKIPQNVRLCITKNRKNLKLSDAIVFSYRIIT